MLRAVFVLAATALWSSGFAGAQEALLPSPVSFWDDQRRGANFFNEVETEARIRDAAAVGIEFIRLTPSKWRTEDGQSLVGDLGTPYTGLNDVLLAKLHDVLDTAERHDVKVVLTLLDLPCLWGRPANAQESDMRLWAEEDCQQQAARVWRDIAEALNGHPALVGYNPLNEPQPARAVADLDDPTSPEYAQFVARHRGGLADINQFNARMVDAIRSVDAHTPIHIEPAAFASAAALAFLDPIDDPYIVYSVHLYPSWLYGASRVNRGRFRYPDAMPVGWNGDTEVWQAGRICSHTDPLLEWAQSHDVPLNRMIVSEFGVSRRVAGAQDYMRDIVECLESRDLHWAFYAFREDSWDEMDYELSFEAFPDARVPSEQAEDGYRVKPWQRTEMFDALLVHLRSER